MTEDRMPKGMRILFLLHALIAGLVGVQHFFAPRIWTDLAGMEISETVTWRVIGAALIGFAASSWMAFRSGDRQSAKILAIMEVIWSILGALAITWGLAVEGLPLLEWVNVATLVIFAAAFGALISYSESS